MSTLLRSAVMFGLTLAFVIASNVHGAGVHVDNLFISKLRVVGDYPGDTFDNTVEIWFTAPITFPSNMSCTNGYRVYVPADKEHLISAAYMAFMANRKISVYVDDSLTQRNGSCEIGYLDVF